MFLKNVGEPYREERRNFLKSTVFFSGIIAGNVSKGAFMTSRQNEHRPIYENKPFWMHGLLGPDFRETANLLRKYGFTTVVTGGKEAITAVREAGMEAWVCGSGFSLFTNEDSLKACDIFGNPQVWFSSGSPCNEAIQEASRESYVKLAQTEGITGILVDGVRFGSPASGLMPFFTDFSGHARQRAQELQFDFDLMKRDVTRLYNVVTHLKEKPLGTLEHIGSVTGLLERLTEFPGLLEWIRFRRAHTTSHFRKLSEIIHGAGLKMGVYIFTPCLAPLVGQSYEDLKEFVDVFAPMIYRNYPSHPGPACLNWELTELPAELGLAGTEEEKTVMKFILAAVGFDQIPIQPSIAAIQKGLPPDVVGKETRRARLCLGTSKALVPIVYLEDDRMVETVQFVFENGANGVNFFTFNQEWFKWLGPVLSQSSN